jgi:type I restriction enzyme M protein
LTGSSSFRASARPSQARSPTAAGPPQRPAGVKANVLFFDRKPPSETPWTKKLWIYDFRTNQSFTLKTRQLTRADLEDFVRCYNPADRHQRSETDRFRAFGHEELVARDKASLDIF